MLNNSEKQSFFAGLRHVFSTPKKTANKTIGRPVKCVRFVDYPVFDIDGKEYSVNLEDSKMMKDVYKYLDSLQETMESEFVLTQKRTYAVPNLDKYLTLLIRLECESVDDGGKIYSVVTHMGIENAILQDKADNVEPEPVTELH